MRCFIVQAILVASLASSAGLQAQDYSDWFRLRESDQSSYFLRGRSDLMTNVNVIDVAPLAGAPSATFAAAPIEAAPSIQAPTQAPGDAFVTNGNYGAGTYGWIDALYWHRVGTGCDNVVVTNTSLPPGADTVLRTSDLHFNGTGGFRVLVGWRPDPACCPHCSAWELSYWGLFGLNANRTATSSSGTLAIPGDLGLASNNFFLTNILNVNYQSQLNNVEFNCIKSCCLCCSQIDFLCGFRYLNLNETFRITGTDFQEGTSNYNVHTDNNLYGLQMGGRYTRYWSDLWSFQLTGKSGLFLNEVHESQAATDFPNNSTPFSLRDRISARGSAVAMLGELDFILIRRLSDTWSLRVGYTVIGLGGLALASDQLDFTDTFTSGSQLHTTGWILIHGGVLGLQARW
jgi:hypothetical protein